MRPASDPGIMKTVIIGGGVVLALVAGVVLVIRGLF